MPIKKVVKKVAEAEKEHSAFKTSTKVISEKEIHDAFSKLSYDPVEVTLKIMEFGKILTGIPIYSYQEEAIFRIIYSIVSLEGATITMLWCRQSGKTEGVAFIIDTLSVIMPALAKIFPELSQYSTGIKIGLFAPQQEQVDTSYSRALVRLGSDNAQEILADPDINTSLKSTAKLHLTNGSYLTGQVANPRSKIESKTYDLIFIEECQDVDSFLIDKSIEPMATSTNGTICKIGTTGTQKNNFWVEIQNNIKYDRALKDMRFRKHFEFDYKRVVSDKRAQFKRDGKIFHLNYEKFVMSRKEKWGEQSDQFRLSYALIWAFDSGMFISDREWILMTNRKLGLKSAPEDEDYIVAGLDIAKDKASTVLTIGKVTPNEVEYKAPKKQVLCWLDLAGNDYEAQHEILLDAIVHWNIKVIFADNTGVGRPVVDRLVAACGDHLHIEPYTFSRPSKSDMWLNLQEDINNARLIVPANKTAQGTAEFSKFDEQMRNLQKFTEGGYLVCEKSPGFFDDYCDSLGLMCLAGNYILDSEDDEDEYEQESYDFNPFAPTENDLIKKSSW